MGYINNTQESYYEGGDFGGYQFVPVSDIITNFILMFTGEGKVIPKASRSEIQMHARRCVQEFSYDIFKTTKSQEIELPPTLTMVLPQDYVNWVKISKIDANGIERPLQPVRITSNPTAILQDNDYNYTYDGDGNVLLAANSVTWEKNREGSQDVSVTNYADVHEEGIRGERFGLDPEHASINGGFFIDEKMGVIHFTGALNGAIISLQYLSDGMGTDEEMVAHKFAEDAIYKYILYTIVSISMNSQEYLVRRYKQSYVAAKRVAKLRLSNLKAGAMTQILRGKSKQIKH